MCNKRKNGMLKMGMQNGFEFENEMEKKTKKYKNERKGNTKKRKSSANIHHVFLEIVEKYEQI